MFKKLLLMLVGITIATGAYASDSTKVNLKQDNKVKYYKLKVNNDRATIIRGPIRLNNTKKAADDLKMFAAESSEPVYLIINSPGGSVVDGFELINTIQALKKERGVLTYCAIESEAFSMAALIALYCHRTYMQKYGSMMFHEAAYGARGLSFFVIRRVEFMKKYLDNLDHDVANQMGITYKQYKHLTHHEWWVTAEEAARLGLVDGLLNTLYYDIEESAPPPFFSIFGEDDAGVVENPLRNDEVYDGRKYIERNQRSK